MFTVRTRCSESLARTGVLHLAHGDVQTPAFVPLATKGAVKTLEPRDVEALGYELILGNTFHLLLAPGPELVAKFGGLHRSCAGSDRSSPTRAAFRCSRWGTGTSPTRSRDAAAAWPRRRWRGGRRGQARSATAQSSRSRRKGSDSAPTSMAASGSSAPETSMEVQAALHSDIALVFDECTPFHVTRDYTARSTERTHRWLERCLRWHERHGPRDQVVFGIVQGGVEPDLRRESAAASPPAAATGIAIGGTLGREKAQMYEVVSWATTELDRLAPERPRHLLGIGEIDDLIAGVERGIDTFDCAMPTRLGRHGMALIPAPAARWRIDLGQVGVPRVARPDPRRLPLSCLLDGLFAWLPALSPARPRAHRPAPRDPPQPELHRPPDGRPPPAIDAGRFAESARAFLEGAAPGAGLWSPPELFLVAVDDVADAVDRALRVSADHLAEVDDRVGGARRDYDSDGDRRGEHERQRQQREQPSSGSVAPARGHGRPLSGPGDRRFRAPGRPTRLAWVELPWRRRPRRRLAARLDPRRCRRCISLAGRPGSITRVAAAVPRWAVGAPEGSGETP